MPAGIYLTGRTGISLAFILSMVVIMPLFRVPAETDPARGMPVDAVAGVDAFGKNEQVMRFVWMLVVAMTGLVITKALDPGMAQQGRGC